MMAEAFAWTLAICGIVGMVWLALNERKPPAVRRQTMCERVCALHPFGLEALLAEARREYERCPPSVGSLAAFQSRYVYDALHPTARIVDASIPEAR